MRTAPRVELLRLRALLRSGELDGDRTIVVWIEWTCAMTERVKEVAH
jgi:hypothetical protein